MLTKLDIINSMLAAVGVDGFTSEDDAHPDYRDAERYLDIALIEVNRLGFWYNSYIATLQPNAEGFVFLPGSTIQVDPETTTMRFALRGRRLFDVNNRTFNLGTASFRAKIVEESPLEDLPIHAADYLRHKARYDFYLDRDGDEAKLERYNRERLIAWQALFAEDLRNKDTTALNSQSSIRMRRGDRIYTRTSSRYQFDPRFI